MLRTELEVLSGKLIRGDLTPIVYDLIKDSPFITDIFEYSSVDREETESVTEKELSGHASDDGCSRLAFEDWISDEVQPISVSRHGRRKNTGR